jgi:hypothetical protein
LLSTFCNVGHCAFDLAGAKTKNVELDKCNILWFKLLENPLKKVVFVNKIQKISEKNQQSLIACEPSAALGKPEPWPWIFFQTKY